MIRQTKQRAAILKALVLAARPLSPPEILELGRSHAPRLGLRTVYRNISEMVDDGQLVGIDYPGQPLRYELVADKGEHPHFICNKCHKLLDFNQPAPSICYSPPDGFTIEGSEVIFYGRCPQCSDT